MLHILPSALGEFQQIVALAFEQKQWIQQSNPSHFERSFFEPRDVGGRNAEDSRHEIDFQRGVAMGREDPSSSHFVEMRDLTPITSIDSSMDHFRDVTKMIP